MSDYLFDKAGDADPEIERLEGLLAPLAYRGAAPRLPLPRRRPSRAIYVAAGVTALAATLVAVLIAHPWRPRPTDWIDTGEGGARVVSALGVVELAPHTRARAVPTGDAREQWQLARGTLTATIHAPPRRFVVTMPHAVVTDLGCVFAITVDEAGRGQVVVREGQVAVAGADGREIVVPAGARVELTERGPIAPEGPHAVAPSPSPSPSPMPSPAPVPTPAAPTPRQHHAAKPPAGAHAIHKSAPPPTTHAQPHATPKNDSPRIEHDALKGLQHDVE